MTVESLENEEIKKLKDKIETLENKLENLYSWNNKLDIEFNKMLEHKNRQIDENRKISRRVDELESELNKKSEILSFVNDKTEDFQSQLDLLNEYKIMKIDSVTHEIRINNLEKTSFKCEAKLQSKMFEIEEFSERLTNLNYLTNHQYNGIEKCFNRIEKTEQKLKELETEINTVRFRNK